MLYNNDRTRMRMPFFNTWRKLQSNEPLTLLEQELANIINEHSEYHAILNNPHENLERDDWLEFDGLNPFLHMALHQALHEQISTNRPDGITAVFQSLSSRFDAHQAKHEMIAVLAECLNRMQQGVLVTEADYLLRLKGLYAHNR